jgi:demethylmenaquinone methyltransferase/2-methoxy-6-polyprenyl-1,4-benzoquinol methylase
MVKQVIDHRERRASDVNRMFSSIAPRYDLLNHLLSFGLDKGWRKRVASETRKIDCEKILDVCTGSGDMAIELGRQWKGKAHIEAIDFSQELIDIGRKKLGKARLNGTISFGKANAEELPYKDEQFDVVTITFGLRNITNRTQALKEFHRVTKPGGLFVCLEFSQPSHKVFSKLYSFYLINLVPVIAVFFGSDPGAYRYLGMTIKDFPTPPNLVELMESAQWKDVTYSSLAGGIVAIYQGRKANKAVSTSPKVQMSKSK